MQKYLLNGINVYKRPMSVDVVNRHVEVDDQIDFLSLFPVARGFYWAVAAPVDWRLV